MATLAYQFTDESDRKDGTKYRKYHLRSRVTVNGVYESFEHGKYFMEFTDRPNSDSKGVLKAICAIDGVYSAEAEFNSRPPVVKRLRELMQEETELLDEPFNVCKCENGLALLIDRDTAIAEIHDFFEALSPSRHGFSMPTF